MASKKKLDQDQDLKDLLALYRSGKLAEMVAWHESVKDQIRLREFPARPLIKGKKKNTGVAVSELVLNNAVEKMKHEKPRVGKSLSQLVEFLLWQYIGSPTEMIEK